MAFKRPIEKPEYADLITSLANSGQQTKNNALYQTIYLLLQRLTKSKILLDKDLEEIDNVVNELKNLTFITLDNETIKLPNSRRLLAGTNVAFDDSVDGERTVNVIAGPGIPGSVISTGYWTPLTDGIDPTSLIFAANEAIAVNVPIPVLAYEG